MAGKCDGKSGFAKVLALDSTMAACSVALWAEGAIVAQRRELRRRGHAEALMPMVEAVLAEAGQECLQLDAVAVTRGPGAYTGIRIGLAAARGLALTIGCPVIGLTTLEVLAGSAPAEAPVVLAVIEARRDQVYAQRFPSGPPPAALRIAAAAALVRDTANPCIAGDAAGRVVELIGTGAVAVGDGQPDAAVAARLAQARQAPSRPPAPLYLRAPDARLPGSVAPESGAGGRN